MFHVKKVMSESRANGELVLLSYFSSIIGCMINEEIDNKSFFQFLFPLFSEEKREKFPVVHILYIYIYIGTTTTV